MPPVASFLEFKLKFNAGMSKESQKALKKYSMTGKPSFPLVRLSFPFIMQIVASYVYYARIGDLAVIIIILELGV